MTEKLTVDGIAVEIRRSLRRKTMGLTVDRQGELVLHAPAQADQAELSRWISQKRLWVHRKLLSKRDRQPLSHRLEAVSGQSIAYLGQNYRLKIVDDQDIPLRFDGQWFFLRRANRMQAPLIFRQWYQDKGTQWLGERVRTWEHKAGASPAKVVVGDLGYKWGSCGKNGVLYFNWKLLQLPVRLVDYVIVHELVHLHVRNHGPRFWRTLDRVLPDWQARMTDLSNQRSEMVWCCDGDRTESRNPTDSCIFSGFTSS